MTPDDLRTIQRAAGLSDNDLAERLGCSPQHVRRMKMDEGRSGHRPIRVTMEAQILELQARLALTPMERDDGEE